MLANGGTGDGRHGAARPADAGRRRAQRDADKPAVGLTMFGVTTPCVQQIAADLRDDYECLVFHATGIGGQSMEKLVDGGMVAAVIDVTTTEVCDLLMGGVFPGHRGPLRRDHPHAGCPMSARSARSTWSISARPTRCPSAIAGRLFYVHNPQVTLMRTTPEENAAMGRWIGERLNRMEGPVRFLLPEGGVSALDAPGQPFRDPAADAALFAALESTVRQTATRQLIRLPHHINDPDFAAALVAALPRLHGRTPAAPRRQAARRPCR